MHTKSHKAMRIGLITTISFISGIIVTIVAAATYDATIQNRATKMITAIKMNASELDPVDAAAYYALVRENVKSLILVLTEVDKGLVALSEDIDLTQPPGTNPGIPGTSSGTTGNDTTAGIVCSGTYPKNDPNASFWPNGGFVTGPSATDQSNRVWKYKYPGTCMFDCATGYTYNSSNNTCEKNEYAWACGFTTGGPTAVASQCNAQTVGTVLSSNCICELVGGPKGNPIAFTVPEGVFDMAAPKTLSTRLPNVKQENLLYCEEILSHPNTNVAKTEGKCQMATAFVSFPGSPDWKYADGGYNINVPYSSAIWGAAGIKQKFFLKDKTTNQIATYTISVINSASSPGTSTTTYAWSCGAVFGGTVPPPASQCNASTVGTTVPVEGAPNGCTCTSSTTSTTPTSPGTSPTPGTGTTPTTPTQPTTITCTGPVPTSNVVKTVMPAFQGVGDWTNTVWKYKYSGSCSWVCEKGYVPSSAKTSCVPPTPGTGVAVTIVDKNGAAVSGVNLSLIYNPNASEGTWTTNPNGYVEMFPDNSYPSAVLGLDKAGYIIFSAEGCSSRSGVASTLGGQPYSYCDGTPLAPGTKIKIVMMPTPSTFQPFTFSPQSGVFYMNDTQNHLITTKISGVSIADTLSCYEVIAHPNVPSAVNTGYCSNPSNFVPFSGNADWSWTPENGGTWNGSIKYDATVYGAAGIKVRVFMKNKATNQVATFDMSVYKL